MQKGGMIGLTLDYEKLEKLLKERHISKRELAKRMNMQENTLTAAFRRKSKKTFSDQDIFEIAHTLDVPFYNIITTDDLKPPKGLSIERQADFYDAGLTIALSENDEIKKQYGISIISKEDEEAIMNNNYDLDLLLRVYSRFEILLLIRIFTSLNPEKRGAVFKFMEELNKPAQPIDKKEED